MKLETLSPYPKAEQYLYIKSAYFYFGTVAMILILLEERARSGALAFIILAAFYPSRIDIVNYYSMREEIPVIIFKIISSSYDKINFK